MIENSFSIFLLLLLSLFSPITHSLQFNQNGEFTILQLTDMHFAGDDALDIKTQELQRNLIQWVKPDLIAVSGDAVTGGKAEKLGGYEKFWKKFTEPINEAQLPYAYIFGNHDANGDLDRPNIVALDDTNPLSLRKHCEGIPNTTNFIVPVYSSRNENELAANIWMFDTGSTSCEGFEHSWGCIERHQLKWYDQESKKIKEQHGSDIHHLAFLHIPIPEYKKMYNNYDIYGDSNDDLGCPFVNAGFFQHVKKNGDISGIFVGHDHMNDFGGWYDDVELVYGRKSGFNAYGDTRGAKVIKLKETVDEKGELKVTRAHYIVNENGTITLPEPLRPRQGPKKPDCKYPGKALKWETKIKRLFWDLKYAFENFVMRKWENLIF